MLTKIERFELEDMANNLKSVIEMRSFARKKIFKLIRKDIDYLKRHNPWAFGKMERGYSSEINDSRLVEICSHLIECSIKREAARG